MRVAEKLDWKGLNLCTRGFQDLLMVRPSFLLMLCGCISSSIASLISQSMYPVLAQRSLVSSNLITWLWLILCSATADLLVCASLLRLLCSLIRTWTDQPLSQGMLHGPPSSPKTQLYSLTHIPVASVWVIASTTCFYLLSTRHPPSEWLRLFFETNLLLYKYPTFSIPVTLHTYFPMQMEQTQCSEELALKLQTLVNNP
jgi:hypothetical protein